MIDFKHLKKRNLNILDTSMRLEIKRQDRFRAEGSSSHISQTEILQNYKTCRQIKDLVALLIRVQKNMLRVLVDDGHAWEYLCKDYIISVLFKISLVLQANNFSSSIFAPGIFLKIKNRIFEFTEFRRLSTVWPRAFVNILLTATYRSKDSYP